MFLTVVGISSFVYLAFDLGQAELVWLILCASVVYVVTAVVFWTQFGGAGSKPRIYSYQINHDGVWVEGKLTPFAQINTAKVKIFLSSMEYSSQPVLQLTLPLNSLGTLKLHFPDEATHKRVMAALKNYIGTL